MDALCALERSSFATERQEDVSSIRRSITSPHQEVWLLKLANTELATDRRQTAVTTDSQQAGGATGRRQTGEIQNCGIPPLNATAATITTLNARAARTAAIAPANAKAAVTAAIASADARTATEAFATAGLPIVAVTVLRIFPKSLRIYSLAVANECRGRGYGQLLLEHALTRARELGKVSLSLEVDAANPALIHWYGANGFAVTKHLPNYYGRRQDALRMHLHI